MTTIEHLRTREITPGSAVEARLLSLFDQTVAEDLSAEDIRSRYQGTEEVVVFFLRRGGRDVGFAMISFYRKDGILFQNHEECSSSSKRLSWQHGIGGTSGTISDGLKGLIGFGQLWIKGFNRNKETDRQVSCISQP